MTKFAVLAAPLAMLGYGLARLLDGRDGARGPGWAWTVGHLLLLASLVLFGVVLLALRRLVGRPRAVATAAVVAGFAGLLAFARLTVLDLVVGSLAADRAGLSRLFDRYRNAPGLPDGLVSIADAAGPPVFYVSLLALTVQLAAGRPPRAPWWSPALVFAGSVLVPLDLDLLPLGSALLAVGLVPVARGPRPAATEAAEPRPDREPSPVASPVAGPGADPG